MTRRPLRPNSLEPLPGEPARPALRLLERSAAWRPGRDSMPVTPPVSAPHWLAWVRQAARRAFSG